MSKRFTIYLLIFVVLAGCSAEGARKLPGVYRIDIQQGNVIEQEMLDKLKPGMVKDQVHFIMGTPTIVDPFHNDRWEYLYTYSKGGARRDQRHITIFFEDNRLAYLEGGVVKGIRRPPEDYVKERKTVDVPAKLQKRDGVFTRLFNSLPFVGEDTPKKITPVDDDDYEANNDEAVDETPPEVDSESEAETP